MRNTCIGSLGIGLLLLAVVGGCKTPSPSLNQPLTGQQLAALFAQARDPRTFWITVYQGANGPVFTDANRLHPEQEGALGWASARRSKAPVVRLKKNSFTHFTALMDTSARESWLSLSSRLSMGATLLAPPFSVKPTHLADDQAGYLGVVDKVIFDGVYMETALFYLRAATGPLGPLTRRVEGTPPDAVIGCDMLKAFEYVQFDYPRRQTQVSSTRPFQPNEKRLLAKLPLKDLKGIFSVEALINGKPEMVILDTAGDFEVAMERVPADGVVHRLALGDLVLLNTRVVAAQDQGLGLPSVPRIGRQLLSRFCMTVAGKKNIVYFEKPE